MARLTTITEKRKKKYSTPLPYCRDVGQQKGIFSGLEPLVSRTGNNLVYQLCHNQKI